MITIIRQGKKALITIEGTHYIKSYIVDVDERGFFNFIPPKEDLTS
jgi:hypothetical protein